MLTLKAISRRGTTKYTPKASPETGPVVAVGPISGDRNTSVPPPPPPP
jgi:hypothetical protein